MASHAVSIRCEAFGGADDTAKPVAEAVGARSPHPACVISAETVILITEEVTVGADMTVNVTSPSARLLRTGAAHSVGVSQTS